jgi:hypothetical protein
MKELLYLIELMLKQHHEMERFCNKNYGKRI